ncbi:MAG: zf-HC2 domain-containing protein [Candidatus Poribacteria bacterium]|nr:zf-HC2 domain-containing protein [Candidatus Poribacteria bacterium]
MTTCKPSETYTDYVHDLLDEEQAAIVEAHLGDCPTCADKVESLQRVLSLVREAAEVPIPNVILDGIEMKVYKRLAAESPQPKPARFLSRLLAVLPFPAMQNRSTWILRGALASLVLAIGIPIATIVLHREPALEVPVRAISVQTPPDRVEQYNQWEIQMSQQEALEKRHLKGDDHGANLQLLMVAEKVAVARRPF